MQHDSAKALHASKCNASVKHPHSATPAWGGCSAAPAHMRNLVNLGLRPGPSEVESCDARHLRSLLSSFGISAVRIVRVSKTGKGMGSVAAASVESLAEWQASGANGKYG